MGNISIRHDSGSRFRATDGKYTVTGGEGDEDEERNNMSPGRLFLASLGMCIASTLQGFCERHDIPFEDMEVDLKYESEDSPSRVKSIDAEIRLPSVPEKFESALIRAGGQCYVKRSIQKGIDFDISLAEAR